MGNSKGIRRVVIAFSSIGKDELEVAVDFLTRNFVVILPVNEYFYESNLINNLKTKFDDRLVVLKVDFELTVSVQQFQQNLFDEFYPVDLVLTDLGNREDLAVTEDYSYETLDTTVSQKLLSFSNLLSCMIPMMNSSGSHFFEIEREKGLIPSNSEAIQVMFDTLKASKIAALQSEMSSAAINYAVIRVLHDESFHIPKIWIKAGIC